MNFTPIHDYLSILNGIYGLAIVGLAASSSILGELLSRTAKTTAKTTGKRPFLLSLPVDVALLAALIVSWGLPFFILYKSFSGERYEFWPLTISIFLGLYAFCFSGILSSAWTEGLRGVRIFLMLAFVACTMMSLIFAGAIRLFEKLHPLWN